MNNVYIYPYKSLRDEHGNWEPISQGKWEEMKGEAHARTTDPTTSHQAAREAKHTSGLLEQLVMDALESCKLGMTNHEIVAHTGFSWQCITPRLRPLVNKGLVVDSGVRRPGPTGKKCIVWRAL